MSGKILFQILVMLVISAISMSGQCQTDQSEEDNEILDYDITVNSNQDGSYNISLRAEKEDCYVYFDDIKSEAPLIGTAQVTSPPASTAPTADYVIHEAGPEWGHYTVIRLPTVISISSEDGKIKRSKDLSKYVPETFNNNYHVKDYIIKSDDGLETGLKIKMQYPKGLMAHEIGLLNISVTTKNQGHNKMPDWQNNILGFCLIKIAGNEALRDENEFHDTTKSMLVDPIIIGTSEYDLVKNKFKVKGVLIPHNQWVAYDDNLREFVKRNYQGTLSAAQVFDANLYKTAIFSLIEDPIELAYEGTEIIFTNFGLDVDSIYSNIEKWQIDSLVIG